MEQGYSPYFTITRFRKSKDNDVRAFREYSPDLYFFGAAYSFLVLRYYRFLPPPALGEQLQAAAGELAPYCDGDSIVAVKLWVPV